MSPTVTSCPWMCPCSPAGRSLLRPARVQRRSHSHAEGSSAARLPLSALLTSALTCSTLSFPFLSLSYANIAQDSKLGCVYSRNKRQPFSQLRKWRVLIKNWDVFIQCWKQMQFSSASQIPVDWFLVYSTNSWIPMPNSCLPKFVWIPFCLSSLFHICWKPSPMFPSVLISRCLSGRKLIQLHTETVHNCCFS